MTELTILPSVLACWGAPKITRNISLYKVSLRSVDTTVDV